MKTPPTELQRHPGLYRAKLTCRVGRDALDRGGSKSCPYPPVEYALFCLLHAVEEIADAMIPPKPPAA
jgi:hypothetical protein